jgi:hypothetical protein
VACPRHHIRESFFFLLLWRKSPTEIDVAIQNPVVDPIRIGDSKYLADKPGEREMPGIIPDEFEAWAPVNAIINHNWPLSYFPYLFCLAKQIIGSSLSTFGAGIGVTL